MILPNVSRKILLASLIVLSTALSPHAEETDVIMNEIMYHPPNDMEDLQYVELFNRGQTGVDLSEWSFTRGIQFIFPPKTQLGPGGYLVVCRNTNQFAARYGQEVSRVGNFSGKLSHKGDLVELSNSKKKVIDRVKYSDRSPWPAGADGYSSSLERICPNADSQSPENWAASKLPASKRPAGTPGKQNDNFSPNLPPIITKVEFSPRIPGPRQKVNVSASVQDPGGVKDVALFYRIAATGGESKETKVPMKRISGDEKAGVYEAVIEGKPEGSLVRFNLKAIASNNTERVQPSANEPRPTYSYTTFSNTNKAQIAFGHVIQVSASESPTPRWGMGPRGRASNRGQTTGTPTRGNGAFVYIPPDGGQVQVFDHVRIKMRNGGFKVHFQNDRTFKDMTAVNIIFESSPRWVLAEPLAYEVYRLAGVPAELTEHIRVWMDGRLLGYYLLVEQPNKSFLARNRRDDSGNLYKLLWYGQDVVSKHEKKTNPSTGHDDLLQLIDGLRKTTGAEQWELIRKQFNVEEFINYYAVNMCIQNWDGFFNNYFTYHDIGGTGKWEIYPWDEDKTWGDYDGASPSYDWYEMPLTYGMNGDRSSRDGRSRFGQGPFGGVSWWRPPGYFSGPLLAQPEFRKKFLARLNEIVATVFTEEKMFPLITALEQRLKPEISVRAKATGEDSQHALKTFLGDIQSLKAQVQNRRKFILAELKNAR